MITIISSYQSQKIVKVFNGKLSPAQIKNEILHGIHKESKADINCNLEAYTNYDGYAIILTYDGVRKYHYIVTYFETHEPTVIPVVAEVYYITCTKSYTLDKVLATSWPQHASITYNAGDPNSLKKELELLFRKTISIRSDDLVTMRCELDGKFSLTTEKTEWVLLVSVPNKT